MRQFVIHCLATASSVFAATAFAQHAASPTTSPKAPTQDAAPSSVYRSAWSGYRPFSDEKVISWKDANDEVLRIGGWRAYLRESQSAQPSGSDDSSRTAPAAKDSARKPSDESGAAHRHGSHHRSKESR